MLLNFSKTFSLGHSATNETTFIISIYVNSFDRLYQLVLNHAPASFMSRA